MSTLLGTSSTATTPSEGSPVRLQLRPFLALLLLVLVLPLVLLVLLMHRQTSMR